MNNNNNSLPSPSTSTTTSITALNNNNNTTTTTIHNNNETINNNNNNQQPSLTHSHTLRTSLDILDITDIRKTFNNHKKNLSNNNINKLIQKFHHFKQIHKQLKKETLFLIINSFLTLCFGLSGFAFGILYLTMIILEYTKVRDDDDTNNNNNTNESNNKTDIFSHWSVFVSIGCFIVFAIFSLTSYRALQTYREEKKKKLLLMERNNGMMNDNNNSLVSPTATSSSVNNIVMDRSNGHCNNNNNEEEKHIVTPMLSELKDVLASDSPHINDLHQ